ncbi:MAG: EAL domain-containing protein [Thiobacillaceae bacterium]|nr:EAL domain-containing protein [Thiobacillaceae bacterium]
MSPRAFLFGSLRRQLVFGVAAVHAVMMSLFVWDLSVRQQEFLLARQADQSQTLADTLAVSAATGMLSRDSAGLQELVDAQGKYPGIVFVMLVDNGGRILAHNEAGKRGLYLSDANSRRLLASERAMVLARGAALVDNAVPVTLNGRRLGWARVGLSAGPTQARLDDVARDGLLYTGAAILIGALLALWMGRRLTRKLHVIRDAAEAVRAGDHAARARLTGEDEAAVVAMGFNAMLDTLVERERDLKTAQERLAASEERLDLALRGANDGIWDWDIDGGKVFFSPRWKSMLGHAESEVGDSVDEWERRVHPDDMAAASADLRAHLEGRAATYQNIHRMRHKDGHWVWILDRGACHRDAGGKPYRMVGTHTDISERIHLERALFEEKELAQVTLASIGDGVLTTDREGRVTFLNPVAERLTGWSNAEAGGRPIGEVMTLVCEDTGEAAANPVDRCREEGRVVGMANHTILVNRDGTELAIEDSAAPIRDRDGKLAGVVMVFHDVTDKRSMTREMAWQLAHDGLTGLFNRREFERRLGDLLEQAEVEAPGQEHAMLYLDLDQFKIVNDTCGHLAGDELLKRLAQLMQNHARNGDTLARLGGDEFGLLLRGCPLAKAKEIAEKLRGLVRDFRFAWENREFEIGVSIGLAPIRGAGQTMVDVLAAADMACYAAKEKGRNRIHTHHPDDEDLNRRREELHAASRIRAALAANRFQLHAQEIRPLHGGKRGHYEVLLRMRDEAGKLVAPGLFIPAAERYGLMGEVDRWVVRESFRYLAEIPDIDLAINLSGLSLQDDGFAAFVQRETRARAIDPTRVCFEITETAAISNLGRALSFMGEMKDKGFRFALDDFGAGMSSFSYLKNLPVDYLKIDGAFVRDIVTDPIDRAFVEAINRIGQVMGKETIAEFVENDAILRELNYIGVNYAQGYGIAPPVPLDGLRPAAPRLISARTRA